MTKIAVIGAGISGLVVARKMQPIAEVTVFEKSRGPGGRMATRYAGDFEFDHGAQFFTARTDAFRNYLQPLIDDGVIANWHGRFAELDGSSLSTLRSWDDEFPHYVGAPRMNSMGRFLAAELNVAYETEIVCIDRNSNGWTLTCTDGTQTEPFDWLVITSPAPQTAVLAKGHSRLVEYCDSREMVACFALMLGFEDPVNVPWEAALVRNADISWVSINSSKPARNQAFTVLVHSTNAWAESQIDDDIELVHSHMLEEALRVTGTDLTAASHQQVHRWRYANSPSQSGPPYFIDNSAGLAACGDWCVRGRVEAAFTSARALAETLSKSVSLR